jgi:serine/threonine-protein kinase
MVAPPRTRGRAVPPPVVTDEEYEERGGPERPAWPWIVAFLFVVAAIVAGFFVWQELSGSGVKEPVGLYQGERVAQAERQIRAAHLVPSVKQGSSEKYKPGFVFKQDPDAGSKVSKGGTVTIWVSTGPPKVPVPDVKGQQWTQAQQALTSAGFVPVEHFVPGNTKGQVSATDPPAGTSAPKGSKVRVNVMTGPLKANVPNVVGETLSQAQANLHSAGFNVNIANTVSSDQPQNTVVSQNPQGGSSATKGDTVNLVLSSGPPQVTVPVVVGETSQQAVHDLEAAGFKVTQQYQSVGDASEDNTVLAQNPDGNSQATKGTTVTITVGQFSPPGQGGGGTTTNTG